MTNKLVTKLVWGASLACIGLLGSPAMAQSSKAAAAVADIHILKQTKSSESPYAGPWESILHSKLHTANQKDLLIDVSLEVGLVTQTLVVSSGGTSDTSEAKGKIEVRVLIDGKVMAFPGEVVFGRRTQKMTAVFSGIDKCATQAPDGGLIVNENCTTPESLDMLIDTMNANAFSFVLPDLTSGDHTVDVQARIDLEATADQGASEARGYIGKGSVTVEEVRMVRNAEIQLN